MKFQSFILPMAAVTASLGFMLLLHNSQKLPLFQLSFPPCRHVVLITAPRHGSTWFLDSVEGCVSRETAHQDYRELISASELWTNHRGPVFNITAAEAADYVRDTCSIKIFPTLEMRGEERVKEFLTRINDMDVPVLMLRRRMEDVYGSLAQARKYGGWGKNTGGARRRDVVMDEKFDAMKKKLDRFFGQMQELMRQVGVVWDELQYEDIQDQHRIVARRRRCVIRNCNFL